eukprot:Nk52_evm1s405 gene=Nk52_evmTU1s405
MLRSSKILVTVLVVAFFVGCIRPTGAYTVDTKNQRIFRSSFYGFLTENAKVFDITTASIKVKEDILKRVQEYNPNRKQGHSLWANSQSLLKFESSWKLSFIFRQAFQSMENIPGSSQNDKMSHIVSFTDFKVIENPLFTECRYHMKQEPAYGNDLLLSQEKVFDCGSWSISAKVQDELGHGSARLKVFVNRFDERDIKGTFTRNSTVYYFEPAYLHTKHWFSLGDTPKGTYVLFTQEDIFRTNRVEHNDYLGTIQRRTDSIEDASICSSLPIPLSLPTKRIQRSSYSKVNNTCSMEIIIDRSFFTGPGGHSVGQSIDIVNTVFDEMLRIFTTTNFPNLKGGIQFHLAHISFNETLLDNLENGLLLLPYVSRESSVLPHCLTHIFTAKEWQKGLLGQAYMKGVCMSKYKANLAYTTFSIGDEIIDPLTAAVVMAHEIAHNLGSEHDIGERCMPPEGTSERLGGYLMFPSLPVFNVTSTHSILSPCSISSIEEHILSYQVDCFNAPKDSNTCGNGVIEENEECDCGDTEDLCADTCCDYRTCKLKSHASCTPFNGPCCSLQCQLAVSGTECSPEKECMMQGQCDGVSVTCPTQKPKLNGTVCQQGTKFCTNGDCSGSICESKGLKNCRCSGTFECHLCCYNATTKECMSSGEISEQNTTIFDVPLYLAATTPCSNNTKVCNGQGMCLSSENDVSSIDSSGLDDGEKFGIALACVIAFVVLLCILFIAYFFLLYMGVLKRDYLRPLWFCWKKNEDKDHISGKEGRAVFHLKPKNTTESNSANMNTNIDMSKCEEGDGRESVGAEHVNNDDEEQTIKTYTFNSRKCLEDDMNENDTPAKTINGRKGEPPPLPPPRVSMSSKGASSTTPRNRRRNSQGIPYPEVPPRRKNSRGVSYPAVPRRPEHFIHEK